MYCGKCGAENAEGAKFCKGCGMALNDGIEQEMSPVPSENTGETVSTVSVNNSQVLDKIKAIPKKVLIGVAAAVIALIAIIVIAVNAGSTINLNDYLTIEVAGYNGYGKAKAVIDWDAIEEEYGSKLTFTREAEETYGGWLSLLTPVSAMKDYVSVSLDESVNLTNGMNISYTWNVNEALSDVVKCKVKYKDGSYAVSGLAEVGSFDAFSDLRVTFSGIAPNGSASIEYNGAELSYYDFNCDKTSGLRNGDVITVSIEAGDMSYYVEKLGMIPQNTEMKYEVSGLEEYIEMYSGLTSEFISQVRTESEDTILAYVANSYNSSSSLSDLKYAGYIFSTLQDTSEYVRNYNNLYVIYKGTVANSDGAFSAATVYFPVRFSNILSGADGISYGSNDGIVGNSYFDGGWYGTKGYTSPLMCYVEIVEANADDYSVECGDEFEAYAKYETVSKLDDMSEEYKETLYADAKSVIENYVASNYNGGSKASDLSLVGEYFLLSKEQENNFANKYIVVYSAVVSNSKGSFDTTTVYFPVEYDGIVKMSEDEFVMISTEGILGHSYLPNSYYSTEGYTDGAEMYSAIVTKNRDKYTYEVSEGLKQFGE